MVPASLKPHRIPYIVACRCSAGTWATSRWHVVFVIEEAPAENRPFEEVVDELSSSVLPEERKIRAQAFLETLYKEGKVFIYDLPADGAEETP